MKSTCALLLSCLALAASAGEMPITEKLYQDQDVPLEAPVGGQIFKLVRKATLRNASGQADTFGRAFDRGFRELRYQGVAADGKPVLRYIEVEIRPGRVQVGRKLGATKSQAPAGVAAYARDDSIPATATAGKSEPLPPDATDMAVDVTKASEFRFGTVTVSITSADESAVKYSLRQTFTPR